MADAKTEPRKTASPAAASPAPPSAQTPASAGPDRRTPDPRTDATPAPAPGAASTKVGGKDGAKGEKRTRTPLPKIDFGAVEVGEVPDREFMVKHRRRIGERDEQQEKIDAIVQRAYARWVDQGRNDKWLENKGLYIRVPNALVDATKQRIRRSGAFYDYSIMFGHDTKGDDGKTTLVFIAKDKSDKTSEEPDSEVSGEDGRSEEND